jgi:hypothetical protein
MVLPSMLIVVFLLMFNLLFVTIKPLPLVGFHLFKHSLASVYNIFLDTFYLLEQLLAHICLRSFPLLK